MELLTKSGWQPSTIQYLSISIMLCVCACLFTHLILFSFEANRIENVLVSIRSEMIAGGARLDGTNRTYSEAEAREVTTQRIFSNSGDMRTIKRTKNFLKVLSFSICFGHSKHVLSIIGISSSCETTWLGMSR
jgi:Na+/melibiose symporter-like transporter